ncbi:MAG: hypothetical protein AMXMBFR13_10220 [Phycisphaerae bacterium]
MGCSKPFHRPAIVLLGLQIALAQDHPAQVGPPYGLLIQGLVTNHLGSGIPGAEVRLEAIDAAADDPPLATGRTSATGDISILLSKRVTDKVRVRIRKEGFTESKQELELDEHEQPWIDAVMDGASRVTGTVRAQGSGAPIAGAQVQCESGGQDFYATTREDGGYSFDTISLGPAAMFVTAKGYGSKRIMVRVDGATATADVELQPERPVELHIVADNEKPAAGVLVEGYVEPTQEFVAATTDDDGLARLHGISSSAQAVHVRLNGDRYVRMPDFRTRIDLPTVDDAADTSASQPAPVRQELTVHRAARLEGKVTEAKTGRPIVGVRLIVGREFRPDMPMTWTSIDGSYELPGLAPGLSVISFQHAVHGGTVKELHLDHEQTAKLNVELEVGRPLAGTVVDEHGDPLDNVWINAEKWNGYSTLGLRTVTGKGGKFAFPNAPAGEIEFTFVRPGLGSPVRETLAAGKEDHQIILKAGLPPSLASERPSKIQTGEPVPDMTLTSLDGSRIKLSGLRGKYVLIDCWATWCGPCMNELPHVKALHKATRDRSDFLLLGISLDTDRNVLQDTLRSQEIEWPQIFGPHSGAAEAFEALDGVGIPYTCLIGPDGKIIAQNLRGPDLPERILTLMNSQPPAQTQPAR